MAGVKVTYTVIGEQALQALTRLDLNTRNLMPVMRDFAAYMVGSVQRNFDAQGRPGKWAPLKLGTMSTFQMSRASFWNKARKDGGRSLSVAGRTALAGRLILTDTSRLRNSIHFKGFARSVEGYTNVKYAAIQHFGGQIGAIKNRVKKALFWPGLAHPVKNAKRGVIPARPFLMFQEQEDVYGYLYPRIAAYLGGK
jgi:phage gpG-like protein